MREHRSVQRLIRETRGAEIAEAAAVLPLMFMILLGIFWFGQAFSMYGAITRAAQEGARAGAVPKCTTCGTASTTAVMASNASAAVTSAMKASKLDPALMQSPSPPVFAECSNYVSKDCSASGAACVQLPVQLLTSKQGGGDCGISVYFQYPYRFWLPFTSVNKQQIMLTAAAQIRIETR